MSPNLSRAGNKYFVIFVDEYIHFTWLFFYVPNLMYILWYFNTLSYNIPFFCAPLSSSTFVMTQSILPVFFSLSTNFHFPLLIQFLVHLHLNDLKKWFIKGQGKLTDCHLLILPQKLLQVHLRKLLMDALTLCCPSWTIKPPTAMNFFLHPSLLF